MNDDMLDSIASEEVNKGGRPTKLTDELIVKAEEYIYDFRSNDDIVPSVAGLACYLDVARSTLYKYEGESERFSDILERIGQKQEKMLINGGLMGDFNAPITKMMMTKHGYSDKQETEVTGKDGAELFPSIVVRYE